MTSFDWEKHRRRELARRRNRRGEDCAHAKLDEAKVIALRAGSLNLHETARLWSVDRKTLRDARDGKTWAHVPGRYQQAAA